MKTKLNIKIVILTIAMFYGQFSIVDAQAPFVTYGDGADGPKIFTLAGSPHFVDVVYAHASTPINSGSTSSVSIDHQSSYISGTLFKVGDLVLLIQMGTCNGTQNWEFQTIKAITNISPQTDLTFARNFVNGAIYTDGPVIKVPQYTTVDFEVGASITCNPWNGLTHTGGVIPLLVNGALTFSSDGNINADGVGFDPGTPGTGGTGGIGGLGGPQGRSLGANDGQFNTTHLINGGGEGIGGAGWGGDKSDPSTIDNTHISNSSPTICCGCETPNA